MERLPGRVCTCSSTVNAPAGMNASKYRSEFSRNEPGEKDLSSRKTAKPLSVHQSSTHITHP